MNDQCSQIERRAINLHQPRFSGIFQNQSQRDAVAHTVALMLREIIQHNFDSREQLLLGVYEGHYLLNQCENITNAIMCQGKFDLTSIKTEVGNYSGMLIDELRNRLVKHKKENPTVAEYNQNDQFASQLKKLTTQSAVQSEVSRLFREQLIACFGEKDTHLLRIQFTPYISQMIQKITDSIIRQDKCDSYNINIIVADHAGPIINELGNRLTKLKEANVNMAPAVEKDQCATLSKNNIIATHVAKSIVDKSAANFNFTFTGESLDNIQEELTERMVNGSIVTEEQAHMYVQLQLNAITQQATSKLLESLEKAGFNVINSKEALDNLASQLGAQTLKSKLTEVEFRPAANLPQPSQIFIPQMQVVAEEETDDPMVGSEDLVNEADPDQVDSALWLEKIRREFSGLSTVQLMQQEKERFQKEYLSDATTGEQHIAYHQQRMEVILNAQRYSTDDFEPREDKLWAFEAIKAYVREKATNGVINPALAYEALKTFEERLNEPCKVRIDAFDLQVSRLKFAVNKLEGVHNRDQARQIVNECRVLVKTIQDQVTNW